MTIDRIQSQGSQYSLLPSSDQLALDLGGDTSARVAAMALLAAKGSRDAAQDARNAEEHQLRAHEDEQVRQLHEQADAERDAGLAQAAGQLASGGLMILSTASSKQGDGWIGGAKASEGLGTAGSALLSHDAAEHQADAVEAGNLAAASKRRLDDLEQGLDQARNFQDTAIEFLRSASRTASETDRAAIFVRG